VLVRSAPAALPPRRSGDRRGLEDEASLANVRILVIDDERTILEGLQVVLGNWGAEVMAAQTRAEALALADTWEQPPDVVVSDLLLQGGDNGLDVLAALERHPRGIGAGTARLLVTGETKPDRLREVAARASPCSTSRCRRACCARPSRRSAWPRCRW
jgi:CheY-like chemotaxis protein